MRSTIDRASSALLTIAAVAIAVSAVRRAFFPSLTTSGTPVPEFLASWREALPVGIRFGDSIAPVTIVEFTDLECPACRAFHSSLEEVLKTHPGDVSLLYVAYPLPMHRFALGAARAAECAHRYGRFREWLDVIYDKQDSLGLKSWGTYANEAGLPDTAAITKCATNPAPVGRIEAGLALGNKIRIAGTPTVIVNGWRFPYTPTTEELTSVIEAIAKGRVPFDTTTH